MGSSLVARPLGLFLLFVSTAQCLYYGNDSTIVWGPCSGIPVSVDTVVCGHLPVPLDYTAPDSNQTLTLQLAKVPATKTPVLGTILLNFGGPGLTGREDLALIGDVLQDMSGGHHDLVVFDPRSVSHLHRLY